MLQTFVRIVVVWWSLLSTCRRQAEAAAVGSHNDGALFVAVTRREKASSFGTTAKPKSQRTRFGDLVSLPVHRLSSPPPNIIPFVVDRIDSETPDRMSLLKAISKMCIQVFFNEGKSENGESPRATPWRTIQISQLRSLMYADLRFTSKSRKEMFVARRVVPASDEQEDNRDEDSWIEDEAVFVDETCRIYNREHLHRVDASGSSSSLWTRKRKSRQDAWKDSLFVKGEVLGYVEVGERPFPLGTPFDGNPTLQEENDDLDDNNHGGIFLRNPAAVAAAKRKRAQELKKQTIRPVIANLAVKQQARRSGVGSRLVEACEAIVSSTWSPPCTDIVLQVEQDNPRALHFYQKRGYQVIFSDPSCRRYDINGLFLRREPITKIAMRKSLTANEGAEQNSKNGFFSGASQVQLAASDVWQTLRDTVFAVSSR